MVLTAQAQRSLKVFTAFASVSVGINAMFFSDYNIQGYEDQPHIFTNIQKDTREWIDKTIFQIDSSSTTTTRTKPNNDDNQR